MNGSTPKFAHCDTRKRDGFYVEFARITIEDEDAAPTDYDCYSAEQIKAFHAGDWSYIGIRAQARCMIVANGIGTYVNIDSPGIWGVESNSGDDYLAELYREECEQLKSMLAAMTNPQFVEEA
jgi:hypothetical protein